MRLSILSVNGAFKTIFIEGSITVKLYEAEPALYSVFSSAFAVITAVPSLLSVNSPVDALIVATSSLSEEYTNSAVVAFVATGDSKDSPIENV